MSRILSGIFCLCLAASCLAQAESPVTVQQAVAQAEVQWTTGDSASLSRCASGLVASIQTEPYSSSVPQAWLWAARIELKLGHRPAASHYARMIVLGYPHSASAWPAYEMLGNLLKSNGKPTSEAAELKKDFAAALGSDPRAEDLAWQSYQAYSKEGNWKEAAAVGRAYLKLTGLGTADGETAMSVAEATLRSGDTDGAVEILTPLAQNRKPNSTTILASSRLAEVYEGLGNSASAKENYSSTWTAYQKCRKDKKQTVTPEAAHAAAEALWNLQAESIARYAQMTAPGEPFDEKSIRRLASNLESACRDAARTDLAVAPRAYCAVGELHSRLADAVLQQGYRSRISAGFDPESPPFAAALPEYRKAVAAYTDAYQSWQKEADPSVNRVVGQRAAVRVFELSAGEGDLYFAWAMDLGQHKPNRVLGENGNGLAAAYIEDCVLPVLSDGLRAKAAALSGPDAPEVEQLKAVSREIFDQPLRPVAEELSGLCHEQWAAMRSASRQLAAAFSQAGSLSAARPLLDPAIKTHESAIQLTEPGRVAMTDLYRLVRRMPLTASAAAYWDNVVLGFYADYAGNCRSVRQNCAAGIDILNNDPLLRDDPLRPALMQLAKSAGELEYRHLLESEHLASTFSITNTITDQVNQRLAELDPKNFKAPLSDPAASRRKP